MHYRVLSTVSIVVTAVLGNVIAQRTLNVVNLLLSVFRLAVLARNIFEAVPLLKRGLYLRLQFVPLFTRFHGSTLYVDEFYKNDQRNFETKPLSCLFATPVHWL